MKRCRRCKTEYADVEAAFSRLKTSPDGRNTLCRACVAKDAAKWYARDPERARRLARESDHRQRAIDATTDEGRVKLAARYRRMYERDPEDTKRRVREWRAKNRERKRASDRARKAALRGINGKHTAGDVRRQYMLQSGRCFWCDRSIGLAYPAFHVDHLIPLRRGGENWHWNIVLSCPRCNCARKAKLPLEWAPYYLRLPGVMADARVVAASA